MTTRMVASKMELHALSTGREPRVATVTRVLCQTLFRCGGGANRIPGGVVAGTGRWKAGRKGGRGRDGPGDRKRTAQEKLGYRKRLCQSSGARSQEGAGIVPKGGGIEGRGLGPRL